MFASPSSFLHLLLHFVIYFLSPFLSPSLFIYFLFKRILIPPTTAADCLAKPAATVAAARCGGNTCQIRSCIQFALSRSIRLWSSERAVSHVVHAMKHISLYWRITLCSIRTCVLIRQCRCREKRKLFRFTLHCQTRCTVRTFNSSHRAVLGAP
jgi:hypothetical protein